MDSVNSKDKKNIVLYHADCPDGFGAAWAAWKKMGNDAEYIGVHHGVPPPAGLVGKNIYMVDFAYPEPVLKDIIGKNDKVTAIDHHVSRENAIKLTSDYRYAVDNSGSVLSWKYFHKDAEVPRLLRYVEDRDLYKFSLEDSRAVCAFLDISEFDFSVWNTLSNEIEDDNKLKDFISKGRIILKYEEELVKRLIAESARLVRFEEFECYAVNAPHMFASDIGSSLCLRKPPLAIIWSEDKERVNVSLRSDGSVDVSKVAEKYGGGGHKSASGFSLPICDNLPWKPI